MIKHTFLLGLAMVLAACGEDPAGTVAAEGSSSTTASPGASATSTPADATTSPPSSGVATTGTAPAAPSTAPATTGTPMTSTAPPAAGTTRPGTPLGRVVLTEADNGRQVVFDGGTRAELRLPESGGWEAPKVDGTSVELVPVNSFAPTGFFTWELARRGTGRTVITVPAPSVNRTFRLTVDVV